MVFFLLWIGYLYYSLDWWVMQKPQSRVGWGTLMLTGLTVLTILAVSDWLKSPIWR